MTEITQEDLMTVAEADLVSEFGLNRFGEPANWRQYDLDSEYQDVVRSARINDETVDQHFDCMIDDLLDMKLLKTRKDKHGIIVVERV